MRLPYVHSGVVDVLISALRAGGYLATDASADMIRAASAKLSETQRDYLAATLDYGAASGTSFLKSTENVETFIDSDNTNSTTPYTNWFRVIRGQGSVPPIDEGRELFSVAWASNGTFQSEVTVGARITNLSTVGVHSASFTVGTERDVLGVNSSLYLLLASGTGITEFVKYPWYTVCGGAVTHEAQSFSFGGTPSKVRGGWMDTASGTQFFVGAYPSSPGPQACIWEYLFGEDDWRIRMNDNTKETCLFIAGSYPAYWDDPRGSLCIGGVPGQGNRDPKQIVLMGTTYANAHLMVVTPEAVSDRRMGLWVYNRSSNIPNDTHLNNIFCAKDCSVASDTIRLFSVACGWAGGTTKVAFSVRANASCSSPGGFDTEAGDLAEYFDVVNLVETYEPGSVMVMDEASGVYMLSSTLSDARVLGIVSTTPGFGLNRHREDAERTKHLLPIALSGTVPTKVSTFNGPIKKMDLLVSGPDGRACKAPSPAVAGTVIAKALANFGQPENDVVVGIIPCLVWKS